MYTKLLQGEIIFFYPHTQLFDEVQHQSAYMCKNIVSKEGEDLSERFAITDDEQPMFVLCLGETMPDIYDIMKDLTHGIEGAFSESMTGSQIKALSSSLASLDVEDNANYAVIRIVDHGAYNPNTLTSVASALRSTIEQGDLSCFYTRVTHPDLTKLAVTMFTAQKGALSQRIIPLRKKSRL